MEFVNQKKVFLNQEKVAKYVSESENIIKPIKTTFKDYTSNKFNCLPFENTHPINSVIKRDCDGNSKENKECKE